MPSFGYLTNNPTWQCVVAAAFLRGDGRYLMHRRPPHKQHGGLWEFPGGKVEYGEEPVNALIRELVEELGVTVGAAALRPKAFAQSKVSPDRTSVVILLYTLSEWLGEPRALEHGATIAWWTPTEISSLPRPPLDVALCRSLFTCTHPTSPR